MLAGVVLTPLKRIYHPQGDVYHALKSSDNGFHQFGEAYFSTVNFHEIKGWKKHTKMTMNLIVPTGSIKFVVYDDRENSKSNDQFFEVVLSADNYARLTIPPGVWLAFQGRGVELNLLLNIASIEHDPLETNVQVLDHFNYNWS
jgi:dTDP-4-dehydrorhamnose 3,5-epimerase